MDTNKLILKLAKFQQDLEAGRIVLPTAMGPGTLKKNSIKAKSITSTMIDVNSLNSVNANTGDLSITGNLTMAASGAIRAGKTAYSDTVNAGYWLGLDSGAGKFRIGSATQQLLWDGTNLSITGSITASSGTIGGWTIGTTDLTADAGAIGLASSGSVRIWLGNATPGSAPFRVTSAGAMTSTSGSIGGWTIDSTGLRLGSGATSRGMDSGSVAFYAGSATPSSAPFNVTTAGAVSCSNLTVTGGAITANALTTGTLNFGGTGTFNTTGSVTGTLGNSSGTLNLGQLTVTGTITLGSGGKIIDADGSFWDQTGITLVSGGSFGDSLQWKVSGTVRASVYASTAGFFVESAPSGTGSSTYPILSLTGTTAALTASTYTNGIDISSTRTRIQHGTAQVETNSDGHVYVQLSDAAGTYQLKIKDSGGTQVFGINSDGELVRPITNDSTAEGTYYGRIPIYINGSLKYISIHNA